MTALQFFSTALITVSVLCSCTTLKTSSGESSQAKSFPARPVTPIPKISADALWAAAQKSYQQKEYNKAYDYFIAVSQQTEGTPRSTEAEYYALRSAGRMNRHPEVLEVSDRLLRRSDWKDAQFIEINQYRLRSLESLGEYKKAVSQIEGLLQNKLAEKEHEALRIRASEILQSRLNQNELDDVASSLSDPLLRATSYFRLAEISLEERRQDQARSYLGRTVSAYPNSEIAKRAEDLLGQLEAARRVEPKTIGVVLPLSGKYSVIAQKTLKAIQMGLGLYGQNQTSFKLAVIDSEGNPDNARRGVERLVREDNVIAIIGSLLSRTAPAVASKANELGVPSIALSQKFGVTQLGPSIFRNSLTSEMQVRQVVKVAMEDLGMQRFAIVYPNDSYGIEYTNLFWDEVLARGGKITAAQVYSPKETDFRNVIQRLVGTFYTDNRGEEYRLRLKDWKDNASKRSARAEVPDDLLPPIADFDAIFIPDGVKAMGQISAMLAYNNVKNMKLLGTNLWNVPGLAKRLGNSTSSVLFVDGYMPSETANASLPAFFKEYKAQFSEEPGLMEFQAYDSALILRQLISQGATNRDSLTRALSQVQNFPGSLGPLTVSADREVQRPLVALTLEQGLVVPFQKSTAR